MKFFDTHPELFKILFAVIALFCITAAGINLYNLTSAPTDENLFTDPPTFLMVSHNADEQNGIQAGDLVVEVETRQGKAAGDTVLQVTSLRPATNKRTTSTLTMREFKALTVRKIPPYVLVIGVVDEGASDRAGMRVGDLILRIDGKTFHSAVQADSILRSGTTGKSFVYTVLRDDKELDLHVVLASLGVPLFLIGFTIASIIFLCIAILLATKRPAMIGARLLS
ncbi:MAG: PDZ domain-containing protein, partial [bacterium]